jgi:hypothetical protein
MDAKSGTTEISPAKIKPSSTADAQPLGLGEHRLLHVMRVRHVGPRRASFRSPNQVVGEHRTAHSTGSDDEALLVLGPWNVWHTGGVR